MSRRAWLALLLLGALWGASYMFIKLALEDLSPTMVVFLRTALAALVLLPLAVARDALGGLRARLGTILALAAIQVTGPFVLISAGEQAISSSLTGIIISATPLFTALLAIWVDQAERSSGSRAAGLLAGFAGVALLIGADLGGDSDSLLGGLAVALAALGYAIGSFIVKRSAATVEPVGIAAATMVASTALVAAPALLTAPDSMPGTSAIAAILVLGLLGTGVAFALFYTLTATIGPARVALVTYIAPVFAVFYGVTLLGESIGPGTIAGLILIVSGSWLAAGQRLPGRRVERGTVEPTLPAAVGEPVAAAAPRRAA